jgi:hypothetical protein
MNDAIDMEDDIARIWSVKDDMELLIWRYVDHSVPMTEDEVWNHLSGIANRLDLLCEKLWDTYCKKFELDAYATPEKLAYRAEWLKNLREAADKAEKATKKVKKK